MVLRNGLMTVIPMYGCTESDLFFSKLACPLIKPIIPACKHQVAQVTSCFVHTINVNTIYENQTIGQMALMLHSIDSTVQISPPFNLMISISAFETNKNRERRIEKENGDSRNEIGIF